MKIILASKSLRRIEVLTKFGYDFTTDVSNADESSIQKEDVKELVMSLAKLKAETVAERHPDSVIIGADTLVSFEGKQIGQPKDKDDARNFFNRLRQNFIDWNYIAKDAAEFEQHEESIDKLIKEYSGNEESL